MEMTIISWLLAHWGPVGGTVALLVLLSLRFGPQYVQNLRERRLASQQRRIDEQRVISQREHDLFSRLDRKDEVLEKLTGNHIQHLEAQLAKTDQFHDSAIEHLRTMTNALHELRAEVKDVRDITLEIKGRVS